MKKEEIKTKKDLYLYETEESSKKFWIFSIILMIISIILAVFKMWLPLAVLFFSYLMGLFSGIEWGNYEVYQEKFKKSYTK